MSVQRILDEFGVKLKKDTQKSYREAQKKKASRYGTPYNENSSLDASIVYTVKETDNAVVFQLKMNDYWSFIDGGRKPTKNGGSGKVKSNIEEWIKRKGINAKKVLEKYGAKPKTYDKAKSQLAFLIARKIHRKGFEGTRFYTKVINDGRLETLKLDLQTEIKKDIIIEINGNNGTSKPTS